MIRSNWPQNSSDLFDPCSDNLEEPVDAEDEEPVDAEDEDLDEAREDESKEGRCMLASILAVSCTFSLTGTKVRGSQVRKVQGTRYQVLR